MIKNRVTRALRLLAKALTWSRAHHQPHRADRITQAREDLTPPPVWPAVQAARNQSEQGPAQDSGMCLRMVRECYGIGPVFADAAGAWRGATHKHGPDSPAPRGFPVFWTGGSSGHGHVAIATGDGRCWSTDILRPGMFDLVPISLIHTRWGLTYVGWSQDLNGVTITHGRQAR